jgi:putative phage-type endonuclease
MDPDVRSAATDGFRIVTMKQGTARWLAWRRDGIGASDAPAIMRENPWKTPNQVLADKLGMSEPFSNAVMERGSALEPEARRHYEKAFGFSVKPECIESSTNDWLRASVDGLSHADERVVEIKCGESVYRHTASRRRPPGYYYAQLQHILAVTGYGSIDFWCYLPSRPGVHVSVPRNQDYIDRLLETEHAFWEQIRARRRKDLPFQRPNSAIAPHGRGATSG